jgi:hypothetical protein
VPAEKQLKRIRLGTAVPVLRRPNPVVVEDDLTWRFVA